MYSALYSILTHVYLFLYWYVVPRRSTHLCLCCYMLQYMCFDKLYQRKACVVVVVCVRTDSFRVPFNDLC